MSIACNLMAPNMMHWLLPWNWMMHLDCQRHLCDILLMWLLRLPSQPSNYIQRRKAPSHKLRLSSPHSHLQPPTWRLNLRGLWGHWRCSDLRMVVHTGHSCWMCGVCSRHRKSISKQKRCLQRSVQQPFWNGWSVITLQPGGHDKWKRLAKTSRIGGWSFSRNRELPVKSVVFAMGWKGERRADLEQAKTHKHQHQI